MIINKDYEVNYWAGGENYEHLNPEKPKRSVKKKLLIVFSFIFVLAITPSLVYAFMNLDFNNNKEVYIATTEIQNPPKTNSTEPKSYKVYIEEPKPAENETTVINNDSYWKITKRVCGEGNNYLSVKDQNDGKALYEGDNVIVNCEL